jgi:hypothetical protein
MPVHRVLVLGRARELSPRARHPQTRPGFAGAPGSPTTTSLPRRDSRRAPTCSL